MTNKVSAGLGWMLYAWINKVRLADEAEYVLDINNIGQYYSVEKWGKISDRWSRCLFRQNNTIQANYCMWGLSTVEQQHRTRILESIGGKKLLLVNAVYFTRNIEWNKLK